MSASVTYMGDLFPDFTLWDNDSKKFHHPNQQQRGMIYGKLKERYPNLTAFMTILPLMLIEFQDSIPDDKERPFLIAGSVTVFVLEGEPFPLGVSCFGAQGIGPAPYLESDIYNDLHPYHVPSKQIVQYLAEF